MPPRPEDPAPADPTPAPNPADPAPAPKTYDEAYVKSLRREAEDNRKKLEALEAKQKERDEADLTATEKQTKAAQEATARAEAAEKRARTALAKSAVQLAAVNAKLVDPDLAFTLLADRIEFDDEGNPKDAAALVAQLAKEKPFLVAPAGGNPNPMNPGGSPRDALTKEAIEKMTPAEINANWDRVQAVLRGMK